MEKDERPGKHKLPPVMPTFKRTQEGLAQSIQDANHQDGGNMEVSDDGGIRLIPTELVTSNPQMILQRPSTSSSQDGERSESSKRDDPKATLAQGTTPTPMDVNEQKMTKESRDVRGVPGAPAEPVTTIPQMIQQPVISSSQVGESSQSRMRANPAPDMPALFTPTQRDINWREMTNDDEGERSSRLPPFKSFFKCTPGSSLTTPKGINIKEVGRKTSDDQRPPPLGLGLPPVKRTNVGPTGLPPERAGDINVQEAGRNISDGRHPREGPQRLPDVEVIEEITTVEESYPGVYQPGFYVSRESGDVPQHQPSPIGSFSNMLQRLRDKARLLNTISEIIRKKRMAKRPRSLNLPRRQFTPMGSPAGRFKRGHCMNWQDVRRETMNKQRPASSSRPSNEPILMGPPKRRPPRARRFHWEDDNRKISDEQQSASITLPPAPPTPMETPEGRRIGGQYINQKDDRRKTSDEQQSASLTLPPAPPTPMETPEGHRIGGQYINQRDDRRKMSDTQQSTSLILPPGPPTPMETPEGRPIGSQYTNRRDDKREMSDAQQSGSLTLPPAPLIPMENPEGRPIGSQYTNRRDDKRKMSDGQHRATATATKPSKEISEGSLSTDMEVDMDVNMTNKDSCVPQRPLAPIPPIPRTSLKQNEASPFQNLSSENATRTTSVPPRPPRSAPNLPGSLQSTIPVPRLVAIHPELEVNTPTLEDISHQEAIRNSAGSAASNAQMQDIMLSFHVFSLNTLHFQLEYLLSLPDELRRLYPYCNMLEYTLSMIELIHVNYRRVALQPAQPTTGPIGPIFPSSQRVRDVRPSPRQGRVPDQPTCTQRFLQPTSSSAGCPQPGPDNHRSIGPTNPGSSNSHTGRVSGHPSSTYVPSTLHGLGLQNPNSPSAFRGQTHDDREHQVNEEERSTTDETRPAEQNTNSSTKKSKE